MNPNNQENTKKDDNPDPDTGPSWIEERDAYLTNYYQPFINAQISHRTTQQALEPNINLRNSYRGLENTPTDSYGMRGSQYFSNALDAAEYDRYLNRAGWLYGQSTNQSVYEDHRLSQTGQQYLRSSTSRNQVVDVNLLGSRRPLRLVAPSPGSFRPTTPQAQHDVEAAGTTPPGEPTSTSQAVNYGSVPNLNAPGVRFGLNYLPALTHSSYSNNLHNTSLSRPGTHTFAPSPAMWTSVSTMPISQSYGNGAMLGAAATRMLGSGPLPGGSTYLPTSHPQQTQNRSSRTRGQLGDSLARAAERRAVPGERNTEQDISQPMEVYRPSSGRRSVLLSYPGPLDSRPLPSRIHSNFWMTQFGPTDRDIYGRLTNSPVDPRFQDIAFIVSFEWQKHLTEIFPKTFLAIGAWDLWTDPHGWGFEMRHETSGHRLKWIGKYFGIQRLKPCRGCTQSGLSCSGSAPCRRCIVRNIPCVAVKRSLRQEDFQMVGFSNRNAHAVVTDPHLLPLGTRTRVTGGVAATIREHTMKTGDDMKGFVLWSIPCPRDMSEITSGKLRFEYFLDPPEEGEGNNNHDNSDDNGENDDNSDNNNVVN